MSTDDVINLKLLWYEEYERRTGMTDVNKPNNESSEMDNILEEMDTETNLNKQSPDTAPEESEDEEELDEEPVDETEGK